jgi:hypothetical protein
MMKILKATRRNNLTSGLQAIQPKNDAMQKMKMPATTVLITHDAFITKTKYATSAMLANKTISP